MSNKRGRGGEKKCSNKLQSRFSLSHFASFFFAFFCQLSAQQTRKAFDQKVTTERDSLNCLRLCLFLIPHFGGGDFEAENLKEGRPSGRVSVKKLGREGGRQGREAALSDATLHRSFETRIAKSNHPTIIVRREERKGPNYDPFSDPLGPFA